MANQELPAAVRDLLSRKNGLLLTSDAAAAGVSRTRLHQLAEDGGLTRLVPGCYAATTEAEKLSRWKLFALKGQALTLVNAPNTYLTGWAASVTRGLPALGPPPSIASVVRPKALGGAPSKSRYGRILVAALPEAHLHRLGCVRIMSAPWVVADVARTARLPDSLVVADRAVREGVDITNVLPSMRRWQGAHRARWVAAHADGAAESPLETLGRFAFLEYDLPLPVVNAWVGADEPVRRVDKLLPWHWIAIEGDGALKYDNRDDASEIVRAQQAREFYLRRLGLDVGRYGWPDVYPSRKPLTNMVKALLRDNPARAEPFRWWRHVPGVGPVEPAPEDWPLPHSAGIVLPAGWGCELDGLR